MDYDKIGFYFLISSYEVSDGIKKLFWIEDGWRVLALLRNFILEPWLELVNVVLLGFKTLLKPLVFWKLLFVFVKVSLVPFEGESNKVCCLKCKGWKEVSLFSFTWLPNEIFVKVLFPVVFE